MFKHIFFILFLCSCNLTSKQAEIEPSNSEKQVVPKMQGTDIENRRVNILDKVTLNIPEKLSLMSDKKMAEVYPVDVRPSIAYSNSDISSTFSFKLVAQGSGVNNLKELLPVIKQQFEITYPQIKWLSSQVLEIGNKQFVEYEFISSATKNEVYSLVYITDIENSLLISTFNCRANQKGKWDSEVKDCMRSIREIN